MESTHPERVEAGGDVGNGEALRVHVIGKHKRGRDYQFERRNGQLGAGHVVDIAGSPGDVHLFGAAGPDGRKGLRRVLRWLFDAEQGILLGLQDVGVGEDDAAFLSETGRRDDESGVGSLGRVGEPVGGDLWRAASGSDLEVEGDET